jgi:DNA-directed RNA polymerase specialized sigma24 family protein
MDIDSTRAAFEAKVRRGMFNPIRRYLQKDLADDRMQEGLASAWLLYAAERADDALLVHHAHLRAIDLSRHIAGGNSKRDLCHPRNMKVLEHVSIDDGVGLARELASSPVRKIVSAIDLGAWLAELTDEDRRMLDLRMAGHTLDETAEKMSLSTSTVFARSRKLGLELAERAGIEVRMKKSEVITAASSGTVKYPLVARAA